MENRNGPVAAAEATLATGTAEREAAAAFSRPCPRAQPSAPTRATTPRPSSRKRIEEGFGWTKTVGGLAQVKVRGLAKVRAAFVFAMAAYNIVRLPKLMAPRGEARPAT